MSELIKERNDSSEANKEHHAANEANKNLSEQALANMQLSPATENAVNANTTVLPNLSLDKAIPLKTIEVPPSVKLDSPEWQHHPARDPNAPGEYMPLVKERAAEADSRVADALSKINTDDIKKSLDEISGNSDVTIDGKTTRLASRSSHGHGYEQALDYFKDKFEHDGFKVVIDSYTRRGETFHNLRAIKTGNSKPNEVVMLGAHIDSTAGQPNRNEAKAPGADDDGTGAVALSEVAHAIKDLPLDRTVVLSLFSGEEQGLWGSRAMAELYKESQDNVGKTLDSAGISNTEHAKVVGMYQMDMVGYAPDSNTVESHDTSDQKAPHALTEVLNNAVNKYHLDLKLYAAHNDNVNDRSDHYSFMNVGIPAVVISEPYDTARNENPNYHSVTDTVDKLNIPYVASVSKMVAATSVEMAGLQGR